MPTNTPLLKFIDSLSLEPERVRKAFLASTTSLTRAQNAFLRVAGHPGLVSLRKHPSDPELGSIVKNFENSTRDTFQSGNIFLLRLKSRTRSSQSGILILLFSTSSLQTPRIQHRLTPICRIYMCWETSQHLRRMIENQQKALQSLSAESASVAQEYVRLRQEMRNNQQHLQSITKGILRTQEEERAKISRDLHDGIGQELTALKMNLDILSPAVEGGLHADNRERWREARSIAEQALQDVRELSRLLRPRMLDDLGLFPTLRWYVRSFVKRMNIPVELELTGQEEHLNSDTQTILFRVVQEGLNNVAKHSHATSAAIKLDAGESAVHLTIDDDGVGFDPGVRSPDTGSGLGGMKDRVSLYRGIFEVYSEPRRGTRLTVSIPL